MKLPCARELEVDDIRPWVCVGRLNRLTQGAHATALETGDGKGRGKKPRNKSRAGNSNEEDWLHEKGWNDV